MVAPRPAPRGYLLGDEAVTARQRRFLRDELSAVPTCSRATERLFVHVVLSSLHDVWEAERDGVPVDHRLITDLEGAGRTAHEVYGPLVEAGLLVVGDYSYTEGRSHTYRVEDRVLDGFVEAGLPTDPAAPVDVGPCVRAATGQPTERRAKTVLYRNGNAVGGDLWTRALRSLQHAQGSFNARAVLDHLAELWRGAADAREAWLAAGGRARTAEAKAARAARLRYLNDARCYGSLCRQRPEETYTAGVYRYRLAYRHQRSGRAGQVGGGLQSCSREMKAAAYTGVPGVRNYDVRSSQVNFLVEEFEAANGSRVRVPGGPLDAAWLEDYVGDPASKGRFAAEVGVPVDVWKTALCALLMGARLPHAAQAARSEGAVVEALREAPGGHDDTWVASALERLREAVGPLHDELRRWHRWLDAFARSHRDVGHGDRLVPNLAGESYRWSPSTPFHVRRAELAAHRLQGREAAFVLHLVLQAEGHGFGVLSHEHDGLVTSGPIPDEATEAAKEAAGVGRVVLVTKPFC